MSKINSKDMILIKTTVLSEIRRRDLEYQKKLPLHLQEKKNLDDSSRHYTLGPSNIIRRKSYPGKFIDDSNIERKEFINEISNKIEMDNHKTFERDFDYINRYTSSKSPSMQDHWEQMKFRLSERIVKPPGIPLNMRQLYSYNITRQVNFDKSQYSTDKEIKKKLEGAFKLLFSDIKHKSNIIQCMYIKFLIKEGPCFSVDYEDVWNFHLNKKLFPAKCGEYVAFLFSILNSKMLENLFYSNKLSSIAAYKLDKGDHIFALCNCEKSEISITDLMNREDIYMIDIWFAESFGTSKEVLAKYMREPLGSFGGFLCYNKLSDMKALRCDTADNRMYDYEHIRELNGPQIATALLGIKVPKRLLEEYSNKKYFMHNYFSEEYFDYRTINCLYA